DEALSMPSYDGWNSGTLLQTAAEELEAHGHTGPARDARRRWKTWLDSRPAEERASESHRFSLGRLLHLEGNLPDARALFLSLAAEHPDSVSYAGYLGVLAARENDEVEAERIVGWLGALHRPYQAGHPALWQARIEARLGRADRALDRLGEAFARGRQSDLWLHTDIDLASLREHPRYRALARPKD
ncbi:MAG: hypothetical protein M3477_08440, partial [Gemmatimonadota bacterium]|nr:hypothetical protein [Gemmatimonadota bacterium]